MRRDTDVDVAVAAVFHQVPHRIGRRGRPGATINAKLLRNRKLASLVECKDLVGAVSRGDGKLSRADGVGLGCLDRAVKLFAVRLHHEGQFV